MASSRQRGLLLSIATAAVIGAYGPSAKAVTFPLVWTPLTQSAVPMGDVETDSAGERNIIGDAANPAAYVAMDATHLYFRIRVDGDPKFADGTFRPHGWGCLIDADADPKTIEFLAIVNGIVAKGPDDKPDQVEWRYNSTTTPDAIDDSVETLVEAYAATEPTGNARVTLAPSLFSGNPDYFIDWAIPLTVIRTPPAASGAPATPEGTPMRFLCGTSVGASRVDSDPMGTATTFSTGSSDPLFCGPTGCFLDRDGDGVPDLTEIALGTNPTNPDSDGDGIRDNIELSASGGAGPFLAINTDGDLQIDALDLDSDNDTHPDSIETALDSDGDGTGNWRDLDSDNDCVLDRNETVAGLRDATMPSAMASSNCPAGSTCDITTGTCVGGDTGVPVDTGVSVDTGLTDSATGDGTAGDGTAGDGTAGDGTAGDGTAGDGTAGDGTTGDGTTGDGTTGDGGDGSSADGSDGSLTDSSVTDSSGDDTSVGADTGLDNDGGADGGADGALEADGVLEGGGCACNVPGTTPDTSLGLLAIAGLATALGARRRKRLAREIVGPYARHR